MVSSAAPSRPGTESTVGQQTSASEMWKSVQGAGGGDAKGGGMLGHWWLHVVAVHISERDGLLELGSLQ